MRIKFLFPFFGILLLDQGTKYLSHEIVLNTGISFGLFPSGLLTVALVVVLIGIALKFGRQFMTVSTLATGLFFGASCSNILDRVLYGGVRDFLPVPFFDIRNNLADWVIILTLTWLFFRVQAIKTPEKV